jgi:peptidoglycan/LPS O-acetylase OafA/YrhL
VNRATSIYLDIVRFSAALAVLLTHLAYARFSGGMLAPLRTYGNDAVMIFFVLSGYVIAFTATTRDRELETFVLNRCARLCSVAWPAIVITIVLDQCGRWLAPDLYVGFWYQDSHAWLRVLTAATYTNELWFNSWRLFSNGPYWSLGYEFWYYVLFAAAWYLRGPQRVLGLLLLASAIGPKILLLLPVWLLGVWVYRVNTRARLGLRAGGVLWFGSIALYAAFRASGLREALLEWSYFEWGRSFVESELRWSNEFLASYFLGPLVAVNFIGFHALSPVLERACTKIERAAREWAGYTFSIYLFHYPLLQFFAALVDLDPTSPLAIGWLFVTTVAACRLLGEVTEKRKDGMRAWLNAGVRRVRGVGVGERRREQ